MPQVRDAMIVAGGGGTRLWPLTAGRPKPLVGFCDAPFLEGVLHRLAAVGIDRVLLVVGADPSPFDVLRPAAEGVGIDLEAVPEPEPLDTAGGVRAALDRVRGTFLVLNGDILTDVDLGEVMAAHQRAGADASLVLTRVDDTSSFGVCVLEGERIVDFVEKPAPGTLPGQDTINAGTYVLEPDAMSAFPPGRLSFERQVFPSLVAGGAHVAGVVSDAAWADLGTPQRYLDGHRAALDGAVAWPSLEALPSGASGTRVAADARIDPTATVIGPVMVAARVTVGAGASVGPYVVLGAGTSIGTDVRLDHSVLGRRTTVGAGSRLTATITGEDAVIGVGVTAPEGAVLGDGVRVADHTTLPADARVGPES
jgi:mannose-1-phosphate guanylyltransferase